MNKTIILDVDECLLNTSAEWLRILESMTGVKLQGTPTDYDLTTYFKSELEYSGLDGFEFWKMDDPYKNVMPVEGAVEACEKLYSMGYRLLAVSKVYTEHTNSKRKCLSKHFPMLDAPIYISLDGHKSDVRGDYIIDDRKENFLGFSKPTKGILFNTQYKQNYVHGIDIPYYVCDTWGEIINYFEEEL